MVRSWVSVVGLRPRVGRVESGATALSVLEGRAEGQDRVIVVYLKGGACQDSQRPCVVRVKWRNDDGV